MSTMGDIIKPFMNVKLQENADYKISDEVRAKMLIFYGENLQFDCYNQWFKDK